MCKVCRCSCDNCLDCRADKTKRPGHKMWDPVQKKLVEDGGGCGCATPGHPDYMDCGCTEGGTENAWPKD